jgi:hypothetical protein
MSIVDDTADEALERRRAVIAGLRELADWLEAHPDLPAPNGARICVHTVFHAATEEDQRALVARFADALGVQVQNTGHIVAGRDFGSIEFVAVHIPDEWRAASAARRSYEAVVVLDEPERTLAASHA